MANSNSPSRFCCCTLQTCSVLSGTFAMMVALVLMGTEVVTSNSMLFTSCSYSDGAKTCEGPSFSQKFVRTTLSALAFVSALEALSSAVFIWGVVKKSLKIIKVWCIISFSWVILHCILAVSFVFAVDGGLIAVILVISVFLLGMSFISGLSVLNFYGEVKRSNQPSSSEACSDPDGSSEVPSAPESHTLPWKHQSEEGNNVYTNIDLMSHA